MNQLGHATHYVPPQCNLLWFHHSILLKLLYYRLHCHKQDGELDDSNLSTTHSGDVGQQTGLSCKQRIDLMSFNLAWSMFKSGFGTLNGNFWLGLEKMYQLTKSSPASLRIEMFTTTGQWFSAEYAGFILEAETNKYAIHLTGYSGDSSDVMSAQNGMAFTTTNSDNDLHPTNCANDYNGGFWFNNCMAINLNGDSASCYGWLNGVQYYFRISRMMLKLIWEDVWQPETCLMTGYRWHA